MGDALRALVLTGSLARDEAGFDIIDGRCKVRGDSEFLVVLKDKAANIPVRQRDLLGEEMQVQLGRAGIDCHVSVGIIKSQYLAELRPHIFGYELRVCGVVVMGEPDILSLIPPFSSRDIPLEDGWQLLSNRIIEFMEFAHEWIGRPQAVSAEGRYRMVKLYLDMATSFLLFESAYEPTYSGRADRLEDLAQSKDGEMRCRLFSLGDFARIVRLCTRFKSGNNLSSDGDIEILVDGMGTRDSLITAVRLVHSLWRWELSKLASTDTQLNDQQLMRRWMKLQPIIKRLPGWGYVLRHSGWYRSWKHWSRWVRSAWKASPRYCIYLAASELFFSLPALITDSNELLGRRVDFQRIRSNLVLEAKISKKTNVPWQQICSEIVLNYREFLEGTRA